ncbi:hypothetical protein GCM10010244_85850 [Streptomyces coeruleorubidus]|nr:hypothetical protein GCM10010244_85850 [Streptomyces bellus]
MQGRDHRAGHRAERACTEAAGPDACGEHGLESVLAVCQSFEVYHEPVGKRIKATVALDDEQLGDALGPTV